MCIVRKADVRLIPLYQDDISELIDNDLVCSEMYRYSNYIRKFLYIFIKDYKIHTMGEVHPLCGCKRGKPIFPPLRPQEPQWSRGILIFWQK